LDLCTITACSEKYILPIKQNMILFHNRIESKIIKETLKCIIAKYTEKKNGYELQLLSLMYRIISELFENQITRSLSKRNAELLGKSRAGFQRVLEYIESNYESEIKLSYVAKLAEMSKGYFCTGFKQTTGKSFTDYLNLFRVEKAAILLKQNKSRITDIALSVGFEDMSYFCRIFKKYMGQAPSFYRRSA
jgi:YesN/AraC family two-component response regulator